jgi:type II protein arginine methyltransferase
MISASPDARALLARAMDHHRSGRLGEAEQDYLGVAAAGYRRVEVMRLLAGLADADGRLELALARWQEVLAGASSDVQALVASGALLHRLGRWNEAAAAFEAAAARAPEHPQVVAYMGVVLFDAGRGGTADGMAAPPIEPFVQLRMRRAVAAVVPFWHIPMMNDDARNDAFERAIVRAVTARGPSARVLDIGTGSGLLAMMAARAGAAYVDSCEAVPVIAKTAQRTVELNGYADRVRVIAKKSTDLVLGADIAEPADVLISEVLSSDLLTEGLLGTFEDALRRLVKPGAAVIPQAVTAVGCLAGGAALERLAAVGTVSGFDLSPFSALACPRLPIWRKSPPWTRLSANFDIVHLDLTASEHPAYLARMAVPVASDGIAVGVVQWMLVRLDADTALATHTEESQDDGSWLRILHTFARPVRVTAGQAIELIVGHDRMNLVITSA